FMSSLAAELEDIINGGDKTKRAVAKQSLSMLEAGTTDLAFGTGLHAIGRMGSMGLRFAGRISGAQSPEVKQAIQEARDGGLGIGAIELNKPFVNIVARVGGVMPLVGGPLRTGREIKGAKVSRELKHILDDVSPPIDLPALGVKMTESARGALNARRALASERYAAMHRMLDEVSKRAQAAGQSDAIIPTQAIREQASVLLGQLDELPRTAEGVAVGFKASSDEGFVASLQAFAELPEAITPQQLEALQKNLNASARSRSGAKMGANEFRIITSLNTATWDALGKAEGLPEPALAAIRKAKGSWVNLKSLEETAAAGAFKRVDRNFFSAGFEKAGSAEIDEIANLYISSQSTLRSPKFIDGLEQLVGKKNRKALARAILHRAADPKEGLALVNLDPVTGQMRRGSSEIAVFDAQAMRRKLGLSDPEGLIGSGGMRQNRAALGKLLEGTPVSVAQIDS
ncbi:hypothetical protein LCGC14_2627740, partial [marine sediment metagenome]